MTAAAPTSARPLPQLAGATALVVALLLAGGWAQALLDGPAAATVSMVHGASGWLLATQRVLGATGLYLAVGVFAGAPAHERRGALSAVFGYLLNWAWWGLVVTVDPWRLHPWLQVVPEMLGFSEWAPLAGKLAADAVAFILLVVGGVLLLSRRRF